ncbi:DMT family transporter [Patescibacteria group bacterium]|nr:DMT family transporter [Patescibacteria group bacterium]
MIWLPIVLISQFANAVAIFLDKFLLTKKIFNPFALTFWTAVVNLLGLAFVFFDFNFHPEIRLLIISLLSGAFFTVALLFFYIAMKKGEASHISPFVGGIVPIVSFVLSYFWLGERLAQNQLIAIAFLLAGIFLISFEKSRKINGWHIGLIWALIAGIFFGISYVFARAVYLEESFSTGFAWARVGCFAAALPLLFSGSVRREIFRKEKKAKTGKKTKSGFAILAINKSLAGLYFLGMNVAIYFASATVVNALAGLQYAILLILIFIVSKKFPRFFREQFSRLEIIQETAAIILIFVGLFFMVI